MDNFNSTLVPLEEMTDMTDIKYDTSSKYKRKHYMYIEEVTNIVTICIELPVLCWAVFALYHQIKANNTILVYVMNLLISDFIQVIARILLLTTTHKMMIGIPVFSLGIGLSVGFMVAIALERYLAIVHPIWYRTKHTKKHSIFISLAIWVFLVLIVICIVSGLLHSFYLGPIVFFILPLPLLLFFLGATWRALYHSKLKPKEKKRILGILALVLLLYFILFLPTIVLMAFPFISDHKKYSKTDVLILKTVSFMFLYISPLIDALLYILIKKDASNTGKVPHCHWRLGAHRQNRETSTVPAENITSV